MTDKTTPAAAPDETLPVFAAVPLATAPAGRTSAPPTDAERNYIAGIITATADGVNAAKVDGFTDRASAEASVGRIKRLAKRVINSNGTYDGNDDVLRFSVGASGDGFAWYAKRGKASAAGRPVNLHAGPGGDGTGPETE